MYYVRFMYSDEEYVAFGEQELSLPVYLRLLGKVLIRKQPRWPSWTKFVQIDEFDVIEEGQVMEDEVQSKFGVVMTREEFEYWEADIRAEEIRQEGKTDCKENRCQAT